MNKKSDKNIMINIMSDPSHKGKHVIVIHGQVFTAKTGVQANKLLDKLEKKYPKEIPAITYIPKADTLILIFLQIILLLSQVSDFTGKSG